jgi:Rrf2 family nitric oxide-sensitive transcriptional repressor
MRLSQHSDYAFRLLIYVAVREPALATVAEIAARFELSATHLQKVVQTLAAHGYVDTTRGRSGGVRLARSPHSIRLGDVAAITEPDFQIAPCMPPGEAECLIYRPCVLRTALARASDAFLAELNAWTLADLIREKKQLLTALHLDRRSPRSPV